MPNLLELQKELFKFKDNLKELEETYYKNNKEINNKISATQEKINLFKNNLDIEKVKLAETVMRVYGNYKNGEVGDRYSCVQDAIYWFTNLKPKGFARDLTDEYYGCKNYDRWTGQRSDHKYGFGPSHGSIVFRIGLNKENESNLTEEGREACIYYLLNLQVIQESKVNV